jgi:hypothetical protein
MLLTYPIPFALNAQVCKLHSILSQLPAYTSPLVQELPSDGVYFYYEDGEAIGCENRNLERIVRVGTHRRSKGLARRIIDHYWEDKDGSVFRKHIGSAMIRRDKKPDVFLRSWTAKNKPYDVTLEAEIDSYIRSGFRFRIVFVENPLDRAFIERNAIRLLSSYSNSSENWLGRYSPYPEIKNSGLWNVKHIGEPLEETPQQFVGRLRHSVEKTLEFSRQGKLGGVWRWNYVNQALRTVTNKRLETSFRLNSLTLLFQETQDGWVALRLARELKSLAKLDQALQFAALAEHLLPLPSRKEEARQEIDAIKSLAQRSESPRESELLIVVGCSRTKIWDIQQNTPPYVAAKDAYVGEYFKEWLEKSIWNQRLNERSWRWIILSGKYGFIEPEHPISDYDVNLLEAVHGPISRESLIGQANRQTRWPDCLHLCDFKEIVVHASTGYVQVVREIFPHKNVKSWKDFLSQ